MLALAAVVAGVAAASIAADNAHRIVAVSKNATSELIPSLDRDSDAMRALNAAPEKTLAA
jgi:tRNA splicing ligase